MLKRLVQAILGSAFFLATFLFSAPPAKAQFSYLPFVQHGQPSFCRLGINAPAGLGSYPVGDLRLGWFLDYGAGGSSKRKDNITYFPMLRLSQNHQTDTYSYSLFSNGEAISAAQLSSFVAARPGSYWFIGNEPDRRFVQDDLEPHVYAQAYHELYYLIKEEDPTAKIVAGAIVQPTPLRLQYLDMVLQSYFDYYKEAMPVDVWAFHNFILNEVDCLHYQQILPPEEWRAICWGADIPPGVDATDGMRVTVQQNGDIELFKSQVRQFRQWMADRGYRNTPAFLSEFGILMPPNWYPEFSADVVNQFMNDAFDFLLTETDPNIGYPGDNNRLIQRFAWYSVDDNVEHNGFLFDRGKSPESARNAMGDNFYNYANSMAETVDFFPVDLNIVGGPPLTSKGTTTVTLKATIGNSGNLGIDTYATVTFYNGNPQSGGEVIGEPQPLNLQGCGEQQTVSVEWASVAPGTYNIYAVVQTNHTELDETNNQINRTLQFSDNRLLIPTVKRDLFLLQPAE